MMDDDKTQDRMLAARAAAGGSVQDVILDVWQRTRIDWSFASENLARAFREHRSLSSDERRFIAETVYGLIRQLRRIDEALRLAGASFASRAPDRARLLAYWLLEAGLEVQDAARQLPDIDWTVVAGIDERLERESDAVRRIGVRRSLPDWLAATLVRQYGAVEADALAAALAQRAPMTVRANLLRNDPEELIGELSREGIAAHRGAYGHAAVTIDTRTNLFGLEAFTAGRFEAQDEGSQLLAELVAPPPKAKVVDYCAGAGGKSLAIAAAMQNRGRLIASDVDQRKLKELRRRVRRAGVSNVQAVQLESGDSLPAALAAQEGHIDRVLVDAPCSGVGSLRRNPEARWRLTEDEIPRFAARQLEICLRAKALLGPGGRLIYATCTMLEAENRQVVDRVLASAPELELVAIKEIWGRERAERVGDGTYLEVLPHRHGTDGFFAAVLRRVRS